METNVASPDARVRIRFHGMGGTLFGMYVVNLLLSVVTLGIYSFWGRTKVRRYIWSQVEFAGDRLEYHGTGKELLLGTLRGLLIFFAPLGLAVYLIYGYSEPLSTLVLYLSLMLLSPFVIHSAYRYRLSRTSWRGIRFSYRGRLSQCYGVFLKGFVVVVFSLGFATPVFRIWVRRYFTRNTYFGNTPFSFADNAAPPIGSFVLAAFLTLPTLYMIWCWYIAKEIRVMWGSTGFGGARFSSDMTGRKLLFLVFSNIGLAVVTLGVAFPWIVIRQLRTHVESLELRGAVDFARILQEAQAERSAVAEGLGDFGEMGLPFG